MQRIALFVRIGDKIKVDLGNGPEWRVVSDKYGSNRTHVKIQIECPEHPDGVFDLPPLMSEFVLDVIPHEPLSVVDAVNLRDLAAARGLHFHGWRPR